MTELTQQQKFERIKQLAKKRQMTLTEINDKSGLGTNSIYHWRTKKPSTDSLSKVAKVLNVSTDYLLGNTDEMMPNKKDSSDSESNDVKEFFKKHEVFSYDGKPISEKDLATIKFILENGYEDK